jgi:hypothetical protein
MPCQTESAGQRHPYIIGSMPWGTKFYPRSVRTLRSAVNAHQIDRTLIKDFFYVKRTIFILVGAILAALVGYFGGHALIMITDAGSQFSTISMIVDCVAIFILIKALITLNIVYNKLTEIRSREVKKAKTSALIKVTIFAFKMSGLKLDELLDFGVSNTVKMEMEQSLLFDALHSMGRGADTLLAKAAVFLGQERADARLRFVVSEREIRAEYSIVAAFVLFLMEHELVAYSAEIDIILGDIQKEAITRIRLKDIVDISRSCMTRRMRRGVGGETFEKYRREAGNKEREIVCRRHSIRITKTDGGTLDLTVGTPQYRVAVKGVLDGDDWQDDRLASLSRSIVGRINDARGSHETCSS